jgi:glycosyltransferase involved in cell wall biosynthesis
MMQPTPWLTDEGYAHQHGSRAGVAVDVSVVVPVLGSPGDLRTTYSQYLQEFTAAGLSCECIFVSRIDAHEALQRLKKWKTEDPRVKVIMPHRWQGEATALSVGLDKAEGLVIITLPSYFQIAPGEVTRVLKKLLEDGLDVVIGWRHPRADSLPTRMLSALFHRLIHKLTQTNYHDITCGLRAMKRQVAEEVHLYGDMHRFFPLLAYQRGFKVEELPVHHTPPKAKARSHTPGMCLRMLLDILTLFFLFKFTKRPLRFFGLGGSALFAAGSIIVGYLGLYRLFSFGGIAGRPLLILGTLLMILGAQFFSIGLLGELLIFTHAHVPDYQVHETLE